MNKRRKIFIDKEITLATNIEKANKINLRVVIRMNYVAIKLSSIILISINISSSIK